MRGLDLVARVPGIRTLEEPAGAFRPVEDAQAAERRGARGRVRSGGGVAAVLGSPERQDAGGGRDEAGGGYEEWLEQVAKASGIETPTREDLAKLDRTRPKKKTSNKEWVHPHDPEARIAKMKDGGTRMAHKFEQAVDLETGAVCAVTVQSMDGGDTASLPVTLDEAARQLAGGRGGSGGGRGGQGISLEQDDDGG